MKPLMLAALAASALSLPVAASAQERGELTFYSRIGFQGAGITVRYPSDNARVPFRVRSVRVAPGEAWEVCTRTRFRGNCSAVHHSMGDINWVVNSVRPLAAALPLPQPVPPPVRPPYPQSLRGTNAEFFPHPTDRAGRILTCNNGSSSCASRAADQFCRSLGWRGAAYQWQERIGPRYYLADVLCVRGQ